MTTTTGMIPQNQEGISLFAHSTGQVRVLLPLPLETNLKVRKSMSSMITQKGLHKQTNPPCLLTYLPKMVSSGLDNTSAHHILHEASTQVKLIPFTIIPRETNYDMWEPAFISRVFLSVGKWIFSSAVILALSNALCAVEKQKGRRSPNLSNNTKR